MHPVEADLEIGDAGALALPRFQLDQMEWIYLALYFFIAAVL